jgi:hypothetical protein
MTVTASASGNFAERNRLKSFMVSFLRTPARGDGVL